MKYFTINELTTTSQKLPNVPNAEQTAALQALVKNVLDPARELLGTSININSGFRSQAINTAIKGAVNSQHCKGEAADIRCTDKAKLFGIIRNKLPFDQLIWEHGDDKQPGWIHVSFRADGKNRKQVLRIYQNGKCIVL